MSLRVIQPGMFSTGIMAEINALQAKGVAVKLPEPDSGLGVTDRRLLEQQTKISGISGRPARELIEMPMAVAENGPLVNLLQKDNHQQWQDGYRWLYDPALGRPVFVSRPYRISSPRGIAVLLHGSCTQKSTPDTLIGAAGALMGLGFYCVIAPKPFHHGFFEDPHGQDEAFLSLDHHMRWLRDVTLASADYFHMVGGHKLPKIIVGRSTGANEALEFGVRYPDHVTGLIAVSPSHPGWASNEDARIRLADAKGLAQINQGGLRWNTHIEREWSYMGPEFPAFPSGGEMTAGEFFAPGDRAQSEGGSIRGAIRQNLLDRVPEGIRRLSASLLSSDTPELLRLLASARETLGLPTAPQSPLNHLGVSTLVYTAAPDLDYAPADPWHSLVWLLAAESNPEHIQTVLARGGEHDALKISSEDPEEVQRAAKMFRRQMEGWLDQLIPASRVRREIETTEKIMFLVEIRKALQEEHLPTESEISGMTDQNEVVRLRARKAEIIGEICRKYGVYFSFDDVVAMANKVTHRGYMATANKSILNALDVILGLRQNSDPNQWGRNPRISTIVRFLSNPQRLQRLRDDLESLGSVIASLKDDEKLRSPDYSSWQNLKITLGLIDTPPDLGSKIEKDQKKAVLGSLQIDELDELAQILNA